MHFAVWGKTIQDYMYTSIAHVIPTDGLPEEYSGIQSNPRDNGGYNYAYNHAGITGYGLGHGGYAFGGQRLENTFAPKKFGPEDCSSWVSKLLGIREQWSTQDLLCAYRTLTGTGVIYSHWTDTYSAAVATTNSVFSGVVKPEDVQAGDIYVSRNFDPTKGDADGNMGTGGHTAVVLGKDPSEPGKAIVIGFNRDMERQNKAAGIFGCAGAGLESRSVLPEGNTQVMFLRPKREAI